MSRKINEQILKEKLDTAIRQAVTEFCGRTAEKKEELYAMCFRMHEDEEDIESRYRCEVIVQTREGYEKSMQAYEEQLKQNGEEYDDSCLLDFKYIPEEYQYSEADMDAFRPVWAYLHDNCIDAAEYEETLDDDEEERLYHKIRKYKKEIGKILAETVADLRKKNVLLNHEEKEFYVFPYIGEDDLPKAFLPNVRKMNEGLDLAEYNKFIKMISE